MSFRVNARAVLELGSELISSDIIAFYELIKNAFDAGSKTGATISFNVVLRRNAYLRLRSKALENLATAGKEPKPGRAALAGMLVDMRAAVSRALDPTAGKKAVDAIHSTVDKAASLPEFLAALDEAYAAINTIEVADNGSGMSLDELVDNFLTIGTPSRKREVDKALDAGGRSPYLGEKGIGRLSSMRLGNRLKVVTARLTDRRYNVLEVDWNKFANIEARVEDIDIEAKKGGTKSDASSSGTTLVIGDLAEDWTEKRVEEMAKQEFARLTDPFVDVRKRKRIALIWNGSRVMIPVMNRLLLDNAHAKFSGKFVGGVLSIHMEAVRLGYPHPKETDDVSRSAQELEALLQDASHELPASALQSLGPFDFEAYWYNRRLLGGIEQLGNQKEVRDLQRNWSGIMLFRDDFRVFPYGNEEDDWLGLDRKALSRPGYVLNKAQFVGHVRISRAKNPKLVDQTNREGLRRTDEERALIGILQHVIRDMLWDFFRETDRKYKKAPIELDDLKADIDTLETRAKNALTKVRQLIPKQERETFDALQHVFNEFRDLSARAQMKIEQVEEDSRQMIDMAGVGLMVESVAHELARAAESALGALERLHGEEFPTEVRAQLETLRAEMKTVTKRLRVLDELSVSSRQRSETFDLVALVQDVLDGHAAKFRRHSIEPSFKHPKHPVRVRLVRGMVVQIVQNLVINSMYWMETRAKRQTDYAPRLKITLDEDPPTLTVSDNGPGVAPENIERVFRPFWSLKEKGKRRGLGLFVARDHATSLGGTLTLSDKPDREAGRLHEFILELPESAVVK
ncbi:signal transduction histidine kinase [Bradyrhizobium sp. GM2.2]